MQSRISVVVSQLLGSCVGAHSTLAPRVPTVAFASDQPKVRWSQYRPHQPSTIMGSWRGSTQPTSPSAGVSLRRVLSQQELPEVPTAYSADCFLASFPWSHLPSPTGSPPQYTTAVSRISVSASASGGTHLRQHI